MNCNKSGSYIIYCKSKSAIYANVKNYLDAIKFINSEHEKQIIMMIEFMKSDLKQGNDIKLYQNIDLLVETLKEYNESDMKKGIKYYMCDEIKNNRYGHLILDYKIFHFIDSNEIQTFFG